jgi:hypothetical protein
MLDDEGRRHRHHGNRRGNECAALAEGCVGPSVRLAERTALPDGAWCTALPDCACLMAGAAWSRSGGRADLMVLASNDAVTMTEAHFSVPCKLVSSIRSVLHLLQVPR